MIKYQRHNNTSSLFLLELILAILFFAVASAFCIQIFVKAHLMSQNARDLNFAVNEVSSMAEQLSSDLAAGTDSTAAEALTDDTGNTLPEDLTRYYDADYQLCEQADAAYMLTIHYEQADALIQAHIAMQTVADAQSVYSLDVTEHPQRRAE